MKITGIDFIINTGLLMSLAQLESIEAGQQDL